MTRIALFSHNVSDSLNALHGELNLRLSSSLNGIVKCRRTGSAFRGRSGDLVVNYGSSRMDLNTGDARVLNPALVISGASNKAQAFRKFQDETVKTVEWTINSDVAQTWLDNGDVVYARTVLQGHSGEGIVVSYNNNTALADVGSVQISATLPQAALYTKAITAERKEFRIHVMCGVITYIQQKRRVDGYRELENYSNVVRNHSTGWIYATQNADVNDEAKSEALKAVAALGLDFGAVDVITRRNEAWVLEVNTAAGLSGTNLTTFADNLVRIHSGQPPLGITEVTTQTQAPSAMGDFEQPVEIVEQVVFDLEAAPIAPWNEPEPEQVAPAAPVAPAEPISRLQASWNSYIATQEAQLLINTANNAAELRAALASEIIFPTPTATQDLWDSLGRAEMVSVTAQQEEPREDVAQPVTLYSNIANLQWLSSLPRNNADIIAQGRLIAAHFSIPATTTHSQWDAFKVSNLGLDLLSISDSANHFHLNANRYIHISNISMTSAYFNAQVRTQSDTQSAPFAAREEAPSQPQPVTPQQHQAAVATAAPESTHVRDSSLVNDSFYALTADGTRTVGQYNANLDHFLIVGWEVPVDGCDVTEVVCITI